MPVDLPTLPDHAARLAFALARVVAHGIRPGRPQKEIPLSDTLLISGRLREESEVAFARRLTTELGVQVSTTWLHRKLARIVSGVARERTS